MVAGLSMPHSPHWYRDRLWVLNSSTGEFGHVDLDSGRFEPIAFCPDYLRGMAFAGDYTVVTLSKPRHVTVHGRELDDRLSQRGGHVQGHTGSGLSESRCRPRPLRDALTETELWSGDFLGSLQPCKHPILFLA